MIMKMKTKIEENRKASDDKDTENDDTNNKNTGKTVVEKYFRPRYLRIKNTLKDLGKVPKGTSPA